MGRVLQAETRRRRLMVAAGVYLVATVVYFAFAARTTLISHTSWNHFALLAQAWQEGHLDLGGAPPAYAGYNDFAHFDGKWFVVFPPFPAVLLLPLVLVGGSAIEVQDGQFFIWLAGIGPAVLYLALEKLRRSGRSELRTDRAVLLSLLFAFGTVYFFSAEQGTVWYAAHVVGVGLSALYLLFALDAERPLLAGLMIGLGFLTRSPLLFAVPLFLFEAVRVSAHPRDTAQLLRRCGWFFLPIVGAVGLALWHNQARFGDPFDFGYQHLTVVWKARMLKWGLFDYHYLGRNLAVVLSSLPWTTEASAPVPLQISGHGLALWVTSPFYLWLLWPRRSAPPHLALWVTVAAVAVPTLLYQNTGWVQFGYRFSNDYAVFLFALLACGNYRLGPLFWLAAGWAVLVNGFGAATFGRQEYRDYYHVERTQRVLHQPD